MNSFSVGYAVERMAIILVFLLIGVVSGKGNRLGDGAGRTAEAQNSAPTDFLDSVILDWLLPVTIIYNISGVSWHLHALYVIALCCCITSVDASLVFAACAIFRIKHPIGKTLLLVVPLGNTAYFGFAAVTALLGNKYLPDAIIFDQIGTTLMLATYGNIIAGAPGNKLSGDNLIVLLRFRPLWGFVAGVALDLLGVHLLLGSTKVLGTALSAALLPVAMIALGSKLAHKGLVVHWPVLVGVAIRVIIGPAIVIGLVAALTSRTGLAGGLIQTATPSMVAAALLAERRGLATNVAYSICAVGIVVACLILPFLAWFLLR